MEVGMSETPTGNSKPYDPVESIREMRDAYLNAVAKTMVEAVNTDTYAQASGTMLDISLAASAPFREALEKSMLQVLQQLSLPSRQDVLSLSERFTNLELRLDDMDATLEGIQANLHQSMLPILQQLVLLTDRVTQLNSRASAPAPKRQAKHAASKRARTGSEVTGRQSTRRSAKAPGRKATKRTASKGR
jgi:hypothetical protein